MTRLCYKQCGYGNELKNGDREERDDTFSSFNTWKTWAFNGADGFPIAGFLFRPVLVLAGDIDGDEDIDRDDLNILLIYGVRLRGEDIEKAIYYCTGSYAACPVYQSFEINGQYELHASL